MAVTEETLEIKEEDIKKALKESKNNKSVGPGNVRIEINMYVGGRRNNLNIDEETIKACTEYKYLGTIISNTGKIDSNIKEKIIKPDMERSGI
ncbi:hypothetical protein ILUMI_24006 [Ignelater luminosus]|uniref:Uncharacterized protein n=1 Tax=Ignelater luminosus TaxID=2038154 RepID=A0A8K0FWQ5_IGNLU|nr:hypothetical protein ILUMI_24006 [Ignelater luminosus]